MLLATVYFDAKHEGQVRIQLFLVQSCPKKNNTKSGILRYFNLTHDTSITSKANPRPAQIVCHRCVVSSPTYAENGIFIPLKIIPQFGITHPDGPKIAFSECRINAAEGTGLNVRDWDCLSSKSDVR